MAVISLSHCTLSNSDCRQLPAPQRREVMGRDALFYILVSGVCWPLGLMPETITLHHHDIWVANHYELVRRKRRSYQLRAAKKRHGSTKIATVLQKNSIATYHRFSHQVCLISVNDLVYGSVHALHMVSCLTLPGRLSLVLERAAWHGQVVQYTP
jgi:hypothetical protein